MSAFRITVDQAAIADGQPAIHVQDVMTGVRRNHVGPLYLDGKVVIVQGQPQQDGARVWIECDRIVEVTT